MGRAGARERARARDDRRRPRLDRRHARAGARALPRGARDRAAEQGPGRRLERGHACGVGRLVPAAELGRLGDGGRAGAARRPRRGAPPGGGRPAAAALSRRAGAAPRARGSCALAGGGGVAGPKLRYPDGRLQRSVRGFPTLWRLATESLFLRKLAPRSRAFNAFYGAGFEHDRPYEAEFLMGAVLLVRREAADTVGLFDEDFFMFSEETDWLYRFRQAGWQVLFTPDAEFVHVGGATTKKSWGPMFKEQVRGHLRFLDKHRGRREAERARRLLLVSLRLRGWAFPGQRGRTYAETARWLAGSSVEELLG